MLIIFALFAEPKGIKKERQKAAPKNKKGRKNTHFYYITKNRKGDRKMENKEKYLEKLLIEYIKSNAIGYDLKNKKIETIADVINVLYTHNCIDFFLNLIFDCDIEISDAVEIAKKAQEEYKNEHENV